jgi:hypothetical protein
MIENLITSPLLPCCLFTFHGEVAKWGSYLGHILKIGFG